MPNNLVGMADGSAQGPPANGPTADPAPQNALAAPPTAPAAPTGAPAAPQKQIHVNDATEVLNKQSTIDRGLRDLLKEPGPVPRKKVVDMAVDLVAKRVMTAQAMAGYLADLPEDPIKIREWAAAHAQTVETGLDQLIGMLHGVNAPPPAGTPMQ